MPQFKLKITETLERRVTVSAKTQEEAVILLHGMYRAEEIVLDADDFICMHISSDEEES